MSSLLHTPLRDLPEALAAVRASDACVVETMTRLAGGEPHWWKRDSKNSTAEVDYLVELHSGIQPIEVKSGSAGSLKSLHQLLKDHPDCRDGIVFFCAPFAELPEQRLRFIPLYFAGSLQHIESTAGQLLS